MTKDQVLHALRDVKQGTRTDDEYFGEHNKIRGLFTE
jgi:hypothetical protein